MQKSRTASTSLDLEYEDALDFVKSRSRCPPAGTLPARRLAGFLDAAAELFVEIGYEAATMTAIAERGGSSIGALYYYFPDKQSIAFTLVNQYSQEVEAHWKPLMEQAKTLTHVSSRRSVH